MNHSGMLRNGRMELWGNFNQGGDRTAFASGKNFVIAFMGSGQTAHFDDVGYSRFASIDPNYSSVKIQDEPLIFVANAGMCIGRGVVSGLQEALGDLELSASAAAVSTAIGIGLSVLDAPVVVATVAILNMIAAVIGTIQSLFMIAQSAGGIYSTATGTGTIYDKLEAFAHDFTIMVVGIVTLTGSAKTIEASLSSFKGAAQELFGRKSRLTPSEVTKTYKGAKLITSFGDFAEYAKGYLDDDALKYAKEVLGNDADDTAKLKKIAQLAQDGSQKIGKRLSKEELKAGLDALWNDGGVEGAIGAIERVFKGGLKPDGIKTWDEINNILNKAGLDEKKVNEILSLPKGSRPDPKTYLSEEYIEGHLSNFQNGVSKIKSKPPVDTEGVGLGTFVMPKSVADDVIMRAEGDVSKLEKLLGLNPGDLGKNPVRVDIENPHNIRIPSGNEAGAWPGYWTPGGYTKPGGVMEAVIDPVPKSEYKVTKYILKER